MYLCVVYVSVGLRALLSCREIVGTSMGSFISEIMSLNLFVLERSFSFPLLFLSFSPSLSLFRPPLFSPLLPGPSPPSSKVQEGGRRGGSLEHPPGSRHLKEDLRLLWCACHGRVGRHVRCRYVEISCNFFSPLVLFISAPFFNLFFPVFVLLTQFSIFFAPYFHPFIPYYISSSHVSPCLFLHISAPQPCEGCS